MMEVVRLSETSACSKEATQRCIPEDCNLHALFRENLKSRVPELFQRPYMPASWLLSRQALLENIPLDW
jgi:hypothetical protein